VEVEVIPAVALIGVELDQRASAIKGVWNFGLVEAEQLDPNVGRGRGGEALATNGDLAVQAEEIRPLREVRAGAGIVDRREPMIERGLGQFVARDLVISPPE